MADYTIRRASVADAAIVAEHRLRMFSDMGLVPTQALAAALQAASAPALAARLGDGSYVGWLAVDALGEVLAGAGADLMVLLPRVSEDGTRVVRGPVPLVVNVYTAPEWRGRGVARSLMQALMAWAAASGCDRVVLHASDAGRHLYESLGFVATNEMRWSPATGDTPDGAER